MQIMTHVPGTVVELAISGMTCEGCASSIEASLIALAGVRSASVDHASGRAVVLIENGVSAEDFAFDADAAVHDAGYALEGATARPERAGGGGCGGACGCGGHGGDSGAGGASAGHGGGHGANVAPAVASPALITIEGADDAASCGTDGCC